MKLNKEKVLSFSEGLDALNVWPKGVIIWYCWIVTKMCFWFWALPVPSQEQTIVVGAIIGMAAPMLNWYMGNRREYSAPSVVISKE